MTGFLGTESRSSDSRHQSSRLSVQHAMAGFSQLESSSTPAFTKRRPGDKTAVVNIGEPHVEQNSRSTAPPLSPVTRWLANLPVILRSASGRAITVAKPLPVARWQSLQWQCTARADDSATEPVNVTLPHEQRPENSIVLSTRCCPRFVPCCVLFLRFVFAFCH